MLSVFCCAVYYSLSVSLYSAAAARMRCATSFRRLSRCKHFHAGAVLHNPAVQPVANAHSGTHQDAMLRVFLVQTHMGIVPQLFDHIVQQHPANTQLNILIHLRHKDICRKASGLGSFGK